MLRTDPDEQKQQEDESLKLIRRVVDLQKASPMLYY